MISKKLFPPIILLLILSAQVYAHNTHASKRIDVQHYTFDIEISDLNDQITVNADILFKVVQTPIDTIYLDLIGKNDEGFGMYVKEVKLNDQPVNYIHQQERLIILLSSPLDPAYTGTLNISYEGIPEDGLIIAENENGERTFFGDNWPNRARHWLSVVDHPEDKASCEFKITAPDHYKVIANGLLREESSLGRIHKEDKKFTHWVCTQPIPTKVMVFGAARFAVMHDQQWDGIPIQHWVYADSRKTGLDDFEPTANVLHFMSTTIGKYPYEKLANVESKTKYGGMENASNIFYNQRLVDGNKNIEALIAHEIAHQWFGNAVTEKSWEHLWLSEGFATYLSHMYIESTYGVDSLRGLLKKDKERVFAYYNKAPNSAVVDPTETNLFQYLNANAYQKGAWVLHMLRERIGDRAFKKGMQAYYKTYCHANADTEDFKKVMERVSGQNLSSFFKQWLHTPGHPVVHGMWKYNGLGKKLKLELRQVHSNRTQYQYPLEIGIYYMDDSEPEIVKVNLRKHDEKYEFKLKGRPQRIVIDPHEKLLVDSQLVSK
ncbi:M1 family metallopeptidase [Porifericola rhodea]|uniref:M1 family metallopeptidase n=1 Tax=Porifericola rhodea TaxID=930972 RepID=UPI002666E458|nr:M1 family metallopeptidase [Porifericola rhodea]WKN30694.1 M1 family metallopeptidase [Porifericola rhodea]